MSNAESSSENPNSPEINTIRLSPRRNRRAFEKEVEEATIEFLQDNQQGYLFRWEAINIYGETVSLALENKPRDTVIGSHAVIHMTQGEERDEMEINTTGPTGILEEYPQAIDFGDHDQIPTTIGVLARALEAGLSPEAIIQASLEAKPQPGELYGTGDGNENRRNYHERKRWDLSRKLAERLFI
jgi:hypothetical protein